MSLRPLVVFAMVAGAGLLAAGCGGRPSGPGPAPDRTSGPPASALAFVGCMRTHGVPAMPEPTVSREAGHAAVRITVTPSLDPSSPQFAAASRACAHLLPNGGVPQRGGFTPAERADYLRAAACMRAHDVPDFPDPTFEGDEVAFVGASTIAASSLRFTRAVARCRRLIPSGLPYSTSGNP